MRKFKILPLLLLLLTLATSAAAQKKTQKTYIPWSNGKLVVLSLIHISPLPLTLASNCLEA